MGRRGSREPVPFERRSFAPMASRRRISSAARCRASTTARRCASNSARRSRWVCRWRRLLVNVSPFVSAGFLHLPHGVSHCATQSPAGQLPGFGAEFVGPATVESGEVAALTWFDVDLDAGTIRIVATKTGGQVRVLKVAASVVTASEAHRKRQAEERLLMGDLWSSEHDALVFGSESGTPLDAANARRFVRTIAATAGVGHLTPYELRHTHASILSDAGTHAEALSDRMGHRDSRTTLAYYRHQLAPVIEVGADVDFTATGSE